MKKYVPVAAGLAAALLFFFAIHAYDRQSPLTLTFNRIYSEGVWGRDVAGTGTSGTGSTLAITRDYRAYLQDFIRTHHVTSVVDNLNLLTNQVILLAHEGEITSQGAHELLGSLLLAEFELVRVTHYNTRIIEKRAS